MSEAGARELSLPSPDGAPVYVLKFPPTVNFGSPEVPLLLPFSWVTGPFPGIEDGFVKLSPGAAAVIQPFSEEARWERLQAALRKKYVEIKRTIIPESVLTLDDADLLGASAGA